MGLLILAAANLLFPVIAVAYLVFFFLSPRRALLKSLNDELGERFAVNIKFSGGPGAIWIHAASVGEAKSVSAIVNHVKAAFPSRPVIITTSTAAGKRQALASLKPDCAMLAPLDFYPLAVKFIKTVKPSCLLIVENELWPNMVYAAHRHNIPVGIINGRLSGKSARFYRLILPLFRLLLQPAAFVCAQSPTIAQRYAKLGAPPERITVTGNIKYDLLNPTPSKLPETEKIITRLGWQDKQILVCGSTHPDEEKAFIAAFSRLKNRFAGLRIIIAPRHTERARRIETDLAAAGISCAAISRFAPAPAARTECLLLDQMGWLASFYFSAQLCFIGGTLTNNGGHNLFEAAIMGKPVIFGPHTYNTPDEAAALEKNGGGLRVDAAGLETALSKLLSDEALRRRMSDNAKETAASFTGATAKTIAILKQHLKTP